MVLMILSLFCCATDALAQPRVRKNYQDLTATERKDFRDAIVALKLDKTDTGALWKCSAPAASVSAGKACTIDADCAVPPGMGNGMCDILWTCSAPVASLGNRCNRNAECDTAPGNGTCDMTVLPLCAWRNRYDKYVCWHDKCG